MKQITLVIDNKVAGTTTTINPDLVRWIADMVKLLDSTPQTEESTDGPDMRLTATSTAS